MGAGKTTVGRAVAHQLGWRFLDLDDVIVARAGRSIPEIFREAGEAAFRRQEREALASVLAPTKARSMVLALGGGTFVDPVNAQALRQAGLPVVFLEAPLEELLRRCAAHGGDRPLFRDEYQFRQLYEARRHSYMKADVRIETTGLSVSQVVAEVVRRLQLDSGGAHCV